MLDEMRDKVAHEPVIWILGVPSSYCCVLSVVCGPAVSESTGTYEMQISGFTLQLQPQILPNVPAACILTAFQVILGHRNI
jgi:hypothetical protein